MTKTPITDEFYLEKFMEIQRANIVLWRKLKTLKENPQVVELVGLDFFDRIDDLVR